MENLSIDKLKTLSIFTVDYEYLHQSSISSASSITLGHKPSVTTISIKNRQVILGDDLRQVIDYITNEISSRDGVRDFNITKIETAKANALVLVGEDPQSFLTEL